MPPRAVFDRISTPAVRWKIAAGGLVIALAASACAASSTQSQHRTTRAALGTPAVRFVERDTPVGTTATDKSWNPHVSCTARITTLSRVLGTQRNSHGGATYAGGGFKPGIPNRRSVTPPCAVNGVPTFVELHRVMFPPCSKINKDGDWTCELRDPALKRGPMGQIHTETDGNFRSRGWVRSPPPGGVLIDVQGFVFWDPGHTDQAWHNYTGWEIHSFTAWRRAA